MLAEGVAASGAYVIWDSFLGEASTRLGGGFRHANMILPICKIAKMPRREKAGTIICSWKVPRKSSDAVGNHEATRAA